MRQLDFYSGGQFFKIGVLVKKSYSIDPETPEKAIISVFKSYLVHLGSFKRYILYFCASIVEDNRTKPCSLLSVFIQTDQMWFVYKLFLFADRKLVL